jgi:hypothetical protein
LGDPQRAKQFKKLVSELKSFIDSLKDVTQNTVSVNVQTTDLVKKVENIASPRVLDLIAESTMRTPPEISEAAATMLERCTTTTASQDPGDLQIVADPAVDEVAEIFERLDGRTMADLKRDQIDLIQKNSGLTHQAGHVALCWCCRRWDRAPHRLGGSRLSIEAMLTQRAWINDADTIPAAKGRSLNSILGQFSTFLDQCWIDEEHQCPSLALDIRLPECSPVDGSCIDAALKTLRWCKRYVAQAFSRSHSGNSTGSRRRSAAGVMELTTALEAISPTEMTVSGKVTAYRSNHMKQSTSFCGSC